MTDALNALTTAYRRCTAAGRSLGDVDLSTALSVCTVSKPRAYAFLRKPENCAALAAALGWSGTAAYSPGYYHRTGNGRFGRLCLAHRGEGGWVKPELFFRN